MTLTLGLMVKWNMRLLAATLPLPSTATLESCLLHLLWTMSHREDMTSLCRYTEELDLIRGASPKTLSCAGM